LDEARATARVDVETGSAQSEISGLRGVFNSFFQGIAEGARSAEGPTEKLDSNIGGLTESVAKGVFGGQLLMKAFDGVVSVFSKVGSAIFGFIGDSIQMNSSLQKSTLQFETLMGDADKAKDHVAFLFDFAKKTPFETGPIIEASRILQTFGGTALNSKENLQKFGDAAAATSAPIQEVSTWSGRLYAQLQAGKPFGEAAQRLGELAIMTPKTRMELENMQKSGASGEQIWIKYQQSLEKFTGAMDKQSHTWEGLTSSISDSIGILGGRVFEPFFEIAQGGLERILDLISDKGVEGAVTRFGEASGVAFDLATEALTPLVDSLFGSTKAWAAAADSASFNEAVVRGVTTVLAGLVDGFAWLVRAIATGVQAYYEFRIAGNLLLTGFGLVVEGILKGAVLISTAMSKITFGDTKREWQAATEGMSATLQSVQKDVAGLKNDTEDYRKKSEETGASMRGFADKLNVASANMRDHAAAYKYVPPAQREVVDGAEAVGSGFDKVDEKTKKLSATQKAAAKDHQKFADDLTSIETVALSAKEVIDGLDGTVYAGIRYYVERHASVDKIAKVYGVTKDQVAAVVEEFKNEEKILQITKASRLEYNGTWDETNEKLAKTRVLVGEQNTSWTGMVGLMPAVKSGLMLHNEEQARTHAAVQQSWDSLKGLSQALANLSQVVPESFSGIVSGLGGLATAASAAHEGVGAMKSGFAALTSPGGGFASMLSGAAGMASGIAGIASAAISMAPIVIGAFKSIFGIKDEWKKVTDDIVRDYDVTISKGLADKIAADSKAIGDRTAATLLHLGEVIKEAGGITAANVELYTGKAHDLFSMIDRHMLTTEQAANQLNEVFPMLAKEIVGANGLAGQSFTDLIALDEKFGTKSKEISDFVVSQIKDTVIPGLNLWSNTFLNAADKMTEINFERQKLEEELSHARTDDERAQISARLAALDQAHKDAQAIVFATNVQTQEAATGLTEAVAVTFAKLRSEGVSTGDAIKQLQPTLTSLQVQLGEAGFTGTAAFNEILAQAALAEDKIAGPVLASVEGLAGSMRGLHNTGLMNQVMFDALSGQVTQAFGKLKAEGKDGDAVLRSMQPTLQMLWEEQNKFGRTVDAATQAMLDEAQANGLVGSQYMSTNDKMLIATERMSTALEGIARKFGVEIPAATDEMARRAGNASSDVEIALKNRAGAAADDVAAKIGVGIPVALGDMARSGDSATYIVDRMLRERVGAAAVDVSRRLDETPFEEWSQRGQNAAHDVENEVDALAFGRSPTGFEGLIQQITKSAGTMDDAKIKMIDSLFRIENSANNTGIVTRDVFDSVDRKITNLAKNTLQNVKTLADGTRIYSIAAIDTVETAFQKTKNTVSEGLTRLLADIAKVTPGGGDARIAVINTTTDGDARTSVIPEPGATAGPRYSEAEAMRILNDAARSVSGRALNDSEMAAIAQGFGYDNSGSVDAAAFDSYVNQLLASYRLGGYARGGVEDFGPKGRAAILHGVEAVVPLDRESAIADFMSATLAKSLRQIASDAANVSAGAGRVNGRRGGETHIHVAVDARGAIFETDATVRRFALKVGDQLAETHFGGQKVSATEGNL
jgi:hypothetical protein